MSAIKVTRYAVHHSPGDHAETWWRACCRRCGLRLSIGSERRRVKREAEAAIASHGCPERDSPNCTGNVHTQVQNK